MKKLIKRTTVTVIVLFAVLGLGAAYALAAGYIQWGGTDDYHTTLDNLNLIEQAGNRLKTERNTLRGQKQTLETEKETLIRDVERVGRDNEQMNNRILDLENQIDSLNQTIVAKDKEIKDLKAQLSGARTTQDQLGQAEKDMDHVEERSREVMNELNN